MAQCNCGREIGAKPHCTHCGSTFTTSTPSRNIFVVDPNTAEMIVVRAFHCRYCGVDFNESEQCFAPPPKRGRTASASQISKFNMTASPNMEAAQRQAIKGFIKHWKEKIKEGKFPPQDAIQGFKDNFGIDLETELEIKGLDEPQVSTALTDEEWNALQQKEDQK